VHPRPPLFLADGVTVEVVSQRPGHASATITLTVHHQVHPGMGREAADRSTALLGGCSGHLRDQELVGDRLVVSAGSTTSPQA
jgi:hypothetical protein